MVNWSTDTDIAFHRANAAGVAKKYKSIIRIQLNYV